MKHVDLECGNCESVFMVEYDDSNILDTPDFCPFCGEVIDGDESFEDLDEDEEYE